jgi:hemerythrin-like domain-containing protein
MTESASTTQIENEKSVTPKKSRQRKKSGTERESPRQEVAELSQRTVRLLSAREIMLHLHNEHKYITKLLNVLKEQVEVIDKGQTPDLIIMADVIRYMNEYSDTSHHPKEDIIYRKLSERDDSQKAEVVNLLIEHEATTRKTETLLHSIREAQRNPDRENLKNLRFRCDDYIGSMNTHMDLEESRIFPRILEVLGEGDWAEIINEIQPGKDPLFGKIVEKHYHDLSMAIASQVERAAEEFTMAQLVGLGAAMENIGTIATYGNGIAGVISKRFREAYKGNAVAYRKLLRAKTSTPGDYVSVTVDCILNNLDTSTEALRDISRILRKARTQIAEPYTTRLRIYHDMVRKPVNFAEDERGQ